jgi:protein associated with RNAse G/E
MKVKIVSTLDNIAEQVFNAKTVDEAKTICLGYLESSKIKESDRTKMITEIKGMKYLHKVQFYIANALLKYEGLGLSNKPSNDNGVLIEVNAE